MTHTINEIATIANKWFKKPNKTEIFELVKGLILSQNDMNDQNLAKLYSFFIPNSGAFPKTDFDWVYKAVAKKDVRQGLNNAYCDGNRLIGTDGYRLHIAILSEEDKEKYSTGYYDSTGVKIKVNYKYPDIDRVLPTNLDSFDQFNLSDLNVVEIKNEKRGVALVAYDFGNFRIQKKYIEQAVDKSEPFLARKSYYIKGAVKVYDKLLIENNNRISVLMGIHK